MANFVEEEDVITRGFERRVKITEESMTALVELRTNDAPPVVITHTVPTHGDKENTFYFLVKPGTKYEISFWSEAETETGHKTTRITPVINKNGNIEFST